MANRTLFRQSMMILLPAALIGLSLGTALPWPQVAHRKLASELATPRWYRTPVFSDEFNGPSPTDDLSCYTRVPYCKVTTTKIIPCPEFSQHLRNLNKCAWTPHHLPNPWLEVQKIYSPSDPRLIEIKDGHITFYAKKENGIIHAGQMDSLGYRDPSYSVPPAGIRQTYGRFEVRAKFSNLHGATGAAWLLAEHPQSSELNEAYPWPSELSGWPYDGELDILEYWSHTQDFMRQTYHFGDPSIAGDHQWLTKGVHVDASEFHTYAAEWTPDFIQFEVDGITQLHIPREKVSKIPDDPMFWIVGLSPYAPEINRFVDQSLVVDFVRNYRLCTDQDPDEDCTRFPSKAENEVKIDIQALPNPITLGQTLELELYLNHACQRIQLSLHDTQGRLHSQEELAPVGAHQLNRFQSTFRPRAPGTYLVSVLATSCGTENKNGRKSFALSVR